MIHNRKWRVWENSGNIYDFIKKSLPSQQKKKLKRSQKYCRNLSEEKQDMKNYYYKKCCVT